MCETNILLFKSVVTSVFGSFQINSSHGDSSDLVCSFPDFSSCGCTWTYFVERGYYSSFSLSSMFTKCICLTGLHCIAHCLPLLDDVKLPHCCPPWWCYLKTTCPSSEPLLLLISAWSFHTKLYVCVWLRFRFIAIATWMLIRSPLRAPISSTPPLPQSRPFPLTPPADFLEPHISPSSVFLFLSSPQPDSPPGQVPPGGPRG